MCGGSGGVVDSINRLVSVIPTQLHGWLEDYLLEVGTGDWVLEKKLTTCLQQPLTALRKLRTGKTRRHFLIPFK